MNSLSDRVRLIFAAMIATQAGLAALSVYLADRTWQPWIGVFGLGVVVLSILLAAGLIDRLRRDAKSVAAAVKDLVEGRYGEPLPQLPADHELAPVLTGADALRPVLADGARCAGAIAATARPWIFADAGGLRLANDAARRKLGDKVAEAAAALAEDIGGARLDTAGESFAVDGMALAAPDGHALGHAFELTDITDETALTAEMDAVLPRAAKGDLSVRLAATRYAGRARANAEGVNRLLEAVGAVIDAFAAEMEGLATGDLSRRIDGQFDGVFDKLKTDFNGTVVKLATILGRIDSTAHALGHISTEVASSGTELSHRTEKHAASLQEAAAALEELTATVRQNTTNAQQANTLAGRAREVSSGGTQVVGEAVAAMDRIENSAARIGGIVGMIEEIAFQINLLALNAAVEAARAGDAGRGFAVVAQEIRNLAQRSSTASKEIKALIADSGREVAGGVALVKDAGRALDDITGSVHKLAAIVAEIANATTEQAMGIDQVEQTVAAIDEATQHNAALVEESAATAHSLAEQAHHLEDQLAFFLLDHAAAHGGARHAALVLGTKIDHEVFRENIHETIEGRNNLTADRLADHHNCRLGKWYDGVEEHAVRSSPWYAALAVPHQKVHEAGKRALTCHASGDAAGRELALEQLERASGDVLAILDNLAKDIRGE